MRTLIFSAVLLLAAPAAALDSWTDCSGLSGGPSVGPGQCREFRFDSTTAETEATFQVMSATGNFYFVPDINSTGGAAVATLYICLLGADPSANTCPEQVLISSTKDYERIASGRYRVTFTAPASGQTAVIQVRGE